MYVDEEGNPQGLSEYKVYTPIPAPTPNPNPQGVSEYKIILRIAIRLSFGLRPCFSPLASPLAFSPYPTSSPLALPLALSHFSRPLAPL